MQFNRTNVRTQQTGKGSVAAAAARHCSFIRRCYERGKTDWKKNSRSSWVFHFVECRDIYPASCRRSNVNGPSLLVNEAAAAALWTWAATLWFTFISFGLQRNSSRHLRDVCLKRGMPISFYRGSECLWGRPTFCLSGIKLRCAGDRGWAAAGSNEQQKIPPLPASPHPPLHI